MAHYALLDENNIITQVITGKEEGGDTDWEIYYGNITGEYMNMYDYNAGISIRQSLLLQKKLHWWPDIHISRKVHYSSKAV